MRGVWLLLLLTGWCSAQQGEYVLAGSVVNARTGEPVKRALVTAFRIVTQADVGDGSAARPPGVYAFGSSANSASVFTDASGAFRFTGMAAGTYSLTAQKPHFTYTAAEREPVQIESASKEGVRLELSPLGSIEGKITDQRGEPVSAISVLVMQTSIIDGSRQTSVTRDVWTDDRGVFRVWDVEPGRYLVKAAGGGTTYTYLDETGTSNGGFLGFVPAYFGGPTADSATPVVIEFGSEARADIRVAVQPTHKVRGRLENLGAGDVMFALLSGDEDVGTGRVNFSRGSGAFEMLEVLDGSYTLRALQGGEAIAELPIVVQGADVSGLRMVLVGPVEIPVNVRIIDQPEAKAIQQNSQNDASQGPSVSQIPGSCQVLLQGVGSDPRATGSQSEADGPVSVLSGKHRVYVSCTYAYLVSAAMGNADLLANPWITVAPGAVSAPIQIVGHHGGATIAGAIKLDQASAGRTMHVLAIPGDSTRDPVFEQVFDQVGHQFSFDSLAPGDYTLYAFSTDQIEYRNPEFLRSLTGGESVHVEDGATATVTITRLVP